MSISLEQTVRVYKINKKKDGATALVTISHEYDFPKHHKADVISAGISVAGTYVMSASKKIQPSLYGISKVGIDCS